jgi:predicted NBD/HSP70 family sugar kinase
VAIGAETIRMVELNLVAQVTHRVQVAIADAHPETISRQLVELIQQLWQSNPHSKARSRGIGMTVPGSLQQFSFE